MTPTKRSYNIYEDALTRKQYDATILEFHSECETVKKASSDITECMRLHLLQVIPKEHLEAKQETAINLLNHNNLWKNFPHLCEHIVIHLVYLFSYKILDEVREQQLRLDTYGAETLEQLKELFGHLEHYNTSHFRFIEPSSSRSTPYHPL